MTFTTLKYGFIIIINIFFNCLREPVTFTSIISMVQRLVSLPFKFSLFGVFIELHEK